MVSVQRSTFGSAGTGPDVARTDGAAAAAIDDQASDPTPAPPPPPPGVSIQAADVMTKLAARVVRNSRRLRERGENGNAFEELIKQKNTGDPTFSFLFHVGSIGNVYYETLKRFESEAGPEALAQRKAAEAKAAKAERRRRRWGPPADATESSGQHCALESVDAATASTAEKAIALVSAEQNPSGADNSRRSAWDVPPAASETEQTVAAESNEPLAIQWDGISIGADGWRQFTLCDGRKYFHRTNSGSEYDVTWERPVAKNHTNVNITRAAAEPVMVEQAQEKLPAVGPVGGMVTRMNTGASAKDALAAAVSRKRARGSLDVKVPSTAVPSEKSVTHAGLGYGGTALGTGGRGIKSRRILSRQVRAAPQREVIDSVQEMRTQLATVDAAILRAPGQKELLSLRSNLLEAIALASGSQVQQSDADGVPDELEVVTSHTQVPAGGTCSVLCAMPDGTGLWCRAVTLTERDDGTCIDGGSVRVRIVTPVRTGHL